MKNSLLQTINYSYYYIKTFPFLLSDDFLVIAIDQYLSKNGNVVVHSHEIRKIKALLPQPGSTAEDRNTYYFTSDDHNLFEAVITHDGIGFTNFDRKLAVKTQVLLSVHASQNKGNKW